MNLTQETQVHVKQQRELLELAGFETRNKYQISSQNGLAIGYAAEQGKGFLGFLFRQFLGHWRRFNLTFFDVSRRPLFSCRHPFRFFFQRLEIIDLQGSLLGYCQQRFSIFSKKFDIVSMGSRKTFYMKSGFFRIWSFPVYHHDREVARISKKWSGLLKEVFLDADSFTLEYFDSSLTEEERKLFLAAALFVDLQYFEKKA